MSSCASILPLASRASRLIWRRVIESQLFRVYVQYASTMQMGTILSVWEPTVGTPSPHVIEMLSANGERHNWKGGTEQRNQRRQCWLPFKRGQRPSYFVQRWLSLLLLTHPT